MPGTKHLMHLAGIDCGPSRLPLKLGAPEHVAAMERWFATGVLKEFLA